MANNVMTNTLVNGVWTTQSIDVEAVLAHEQKQQEKKTVEGSIQAPVYGLLTRTVIPSPVVNWILPARIRHMEKNDVLFIGDDFVLLREFSDGKLHDIASKSDFGSRIRSAIVIGNIPLISATSPSSNDEDSDTQMIDMPAVGSNGDSTAESGIPPQYLVLALESGDLVFLYFDNGGLPEKAMQWVSRREKVPDDMAASQAGTHLTVDPSARYIALSCFENLFAIYELRSRSEIDQQYTDGNCFDPVKDKRHNIASGIIHKIEFLYPDPKDKDRIILLLMVVKGGRSKLFVYVWDAGNDLNTVRPLNLSGHLVSSEAQLPILLIPLWINSNFLLVSEECTVLFKGILEDAPEERSSPLPTLKGITDHHHGILPPKYTAWARPRRLKEWTYENDFIYLAREDGAIAYIDYSIGDDIKGIDSADVVECNIGKAFACIDADQAVGRKNYNWRPKEAPDHIVIGGDMSNGAIYSVNPRKYFEKLMPIANWTPTPDFVVVPDHRSKRKKISHTESNGNSGKANINGIKATSRENGFTWPDKMFMCTGRGKEGAIAEMLYGLEAQIGANAFLPKTLIRQIWALPDPINARMLFLLLSCSEDSTLFHFNTDEDSLVTIADEDTWLNLSSETLLAQKIGNHLIQVTNAEFRISRFLVLSPEDQISEHLRTGSFPSSPGNKYSNAVIHENLLYMSSRSDFGADFTMSVFQLDLEDEPRAEELFASIALDEEPTCLFMTNINGEPLGFYALSSKPGQILVLEMSGKVHQISLHSGHDDEVRDGVCNSLLVVQDGSRPILLCGFRDGSFRTYIILNPLLTIEAAAANDLTPGVFGFIKDTLESGQTPFVLLPRDSTQIGTTDVTVTVDHSSSGAAFLQCDPDIYRFTFDHAGGDELSMSSLHKILLRDYKKDPSTELPPANSVTRINHPESNYNDQLLISSGSQLIMADLDPAPKAVLRTMVIGATPTGLYYTDYSAPCPTSLSVSTPISVSSFTDRIAALVVAVNLPIDALQGGSNQTPKGKLFGQTNILFIDSNSGTNLSRAMAKPGIPQEFIRELGTREKIISLGEWTFEKEGSTFVYTLAATSDGKLLLISSKAVGPTIIEYWTRKAIKFHNPVYSFAGIGSDIFICEDNFVHWQTLDTTEKKFIKVAHYMLLSPGVSIQIEGDLISIVTARHSMMVLKISREENKILPYLTDQVARSGLEQQVVPNHPLRLMSERTNSVIGLWYKDNTTYTDATITIFEAELSSAIIKFQTGTRRRKTNKLCASDVEWFEAHEDTNARSGDQGKILGIAINGSVHSFEVLSKSTWELLRYIQNIAMFSPVVCPYTFDRVERDQWQNYQIDPLLSSKPSAKHVNGDILARCKATGRKGFFELLKQPLPEDDDLENPDSRCERFVALVEECVEEGVKREGWNPYWEGYKIMCWHLQAVF